MEATDDLMTGQAMDRERWMRDVLDRLERPLVAYVRRRLGDPETARDIVQESLLRLCRADPTPVAGHLRPWLYRVCRNLAIDHLRKDGRMHALETTERLVDETGHAEPHAAAAEGDEHSALAISVLTLTPRQQEVVRLRFQDALSYREIAVVTGASVSHVGVLLHQALASLRRSMVEQPARTPCEKAACERNAS